MSPFHTLMDASEESLWAIKQGVSICVWCSQCSRPVVVTLCQPMSINPQPEPAHCPTCGLAFGWPMIEDGIHAAAALYVKTGERWILGTRTPRTATNTIQAANLATLMDATCEALPDGKFRHTYTAKKTT